jgi:hypothetical protein
MCAARRVRVTYAASITTTRNQAQRILEKLDVHERRDAVRRGRRLGMGAARIERMIECSASFTPPWQIYKLFAC